eukprot:11699615-Alexandrium_andersonii.AAC.1
MRNVLKTYWPDALEASEAPGNSGGAHASRLAAVSGCFRRVQRTMLETATAESEVERAEAVSYTHLRAHETSAHL